MKADDRRIKFIFVFSLGLVMIAASSSVAFAKHSNEKDKSSVAPATDKKDVQDEVKPEVKAVAVEAKQASEPAKAEPVPAGRVEVHILSVSDRSAVSKTVSVEVNALADEGIASVEIYADGEGSTSFKEAPYKIDWDTTKVKDGPATIYALAKDKYGMIARQEIHVIVKNGKEKK